MKRNDIIPNLLAKQTLPLEEHLREALQAGRIQRCYTPITGRRKKESLERFAARLRRNATQYQFAQVLFNGENRYVAFGVSGPVITKSGRFLLVPAQVIGGRWGIHYFLFSPHLNTALRRKELFIRLDSGCVSGQVFGDITCDCREQFEMALKTCAKEKAGIVVHIPGHDGRGWAQFKSANQQLMDECDLDTVKAARLFYEDENNIDQRTYIEVGIILRAFGFDERHVFNLATNNPRKIGAFIALGLYVKKAHSIVAKKPNPLLERNLAAKSEQWKHNFRNSSVNQEVSLRKFL